MFIRKVKTRTLKDGRTYYATRLVHNVRYGNKVKQETLLNLGSNYNIHERNWTKLSHRVQELFVGQETFLPPLPKHLEDEAERIVQLLFDQRSERLKKAKLAQEEVADPIWKTVDVSSTRMRYPRSVGVEHVALWALKQLGVPRLLRRLGFKGKMERAALGSIVGRMASPGSERATYNWLCSESGLEEFLDSSFTKMSLMQLYRASDQLVAYRDQIEDHIFDKALKVFNVEPTVTLFDLTNTYFEGTAEKSEFAKHGKSKEKRSDCPLVTLAMVLDGSGFVRRSHLYPGNISEGKTLEDMLLAVNAPKEAVVIMDRGIATEANVQWLKDQKYKYVVVSRENKREFDPEGQDVVQVNEHLELYEVRGKEEVRVHCRSSQRGKKEEAMIARRREDFEAKLQALNEGLSRPKTTKKLDLVKRRIGRFIEGSDGMGQHYKIDVIPDEKEEKAVEVKWEIIPKKHSMWTDPGTYILRSNVHEYTKEQFWQTYVLLTDLEAVFRSLKSELGLRPIFHQIDKRIDGHLFITVLAYQAIQVVRTRLRQKGVNKSWATIRSMLRSQRRATYTQKLKEGGSVHVRVTSDPEADQREIYEALNINPRPLSRKTTTV